MGPFESSILVSVIAGTTLAGLLGLWAMMRTFIKEQRKANEANVEFMRSMQRSELNRYFRIVVEERQPISPEEMSHLESCYQAYHNNGGNGTGSLMYERICKFAVIKTAVDK